MLIALSITSHGWIKSRSYCATGGKESILAATQYRQKIFFSHKQKRALPLRAANYFKILLLSRR